MCVFLRLVYISGAPSDVRTSMAFIFGGNTQGSAQKVDPVRDYQRELRHAKRGMDREDLKAAAQERVIVADITRQAKEQRLDQCKSRARDLIRLRSHRSRLDTMKGHMTALSQQLSAVQGAKSMHEIMGKTTRLLQGLNKTMDPRAVHRMLIDFERQSSTFSASQEVVEETLDSMFEVDGEQEATDEAMASVFQELGLDLSFNMSSAQPLMDLQAMPDVTDIEARLNNLRAKQ